MEFLTFSAVMERCLVVTGAMVQLALGPGLARASGKFFPHSVESLRLNRHCQTLEKQTPRVLSIAVLLTVHEPLKSDAGSSTGTRADWQVGVTGRRLTERPNAILICPNPPPNIPQLGREINRHHPQITFVVPGMAMGYRPFASGRTGGFEASVKFSSPGASSRFDASASSQVII